MDYSLLTEDILLKRFDSLPDHIQELVSSEQAQKLVVQIGKSHYMSREKIEVLEQIVTLILMGFIHSRNLKREISDRLFLNYDHTIALANDLDQELFREIRLDLEQIYTPIEEEISNQKTAREGTGTEKFIPERESSGDAEIVIPIHEEIARPLNENGPFMLVEEKFVMGETEKKGGKFKDFSKAFSFFSPKQLSESTSPVRARVETPKEKKVIHYSELRSPISVFDRGGDFIDLKLSKKTETPQALDKKLGIRPKDSAPSTMNSSEPNITREGRGAEILEINPVRNLHRISESSQELSKKVTLATEQPGIISNGIKLKPKSYAIEKETIHTTIKQETIAQKPQIQQEVKLQGNKIDLRNI